jgi:hypothetical protein
MSAMSRSRTESFLLVVDLLPLRLRGLVATESPLTAAAVADLGTAMAARANLLNRVAYLLGEYDWDLTIVRGYQLEARRHCRRVEVERMFAAHPDLAALATVYLEDRLGFEARPGQNELFWVEDESRLVAA